MLEAGKGAGKCADINTLFVALCRSAGVPARDVYACEGGIVSRLQESGKEREYYESAALSREFYAVGRLGAR